MGTDRGAAIAGHDGLGRRQLAGALLAVAAIAFAACGESESVPAPTPTLAEPSPTPLATPLPAGDPRSSVEAAIRACRAKNVEMLAALVIGASNEEIEAMFSRGTDLQLRTFTFPQDTGDIVSVRVLLLIQRETGAEEVERTWELERTPDGWLFTSVPDCF